MSKQRRASRSPGTGRSHTTPKSSSPVSTAAPPSATAPLSTVSILQLQQTAGNQAVQRLLRNRTTPSPASGGVLQRKLVSGQLNKRTHLIKINDHSLLHGEQQETLYPTDVVLVDDADRLWSRRGPNAADSLQFYRRESDTRYKYFRVFRHNDRDVSGDYVYVRWTAFDFMDADADVEEATDEAKKKGVLRDMLRDVDEIVAGNIRMARETKRLLGRFGDLVESAPDSSSVNKGSYEEGLGRAQDEIDNEIIVKAQELQSAARDERYKPDPVSETVQRLHRRAYRNRREILSTLAMIELNTTNLGRRALDEETEEAEEGQVNLWREILGIGDEAFDLRTEGTAEAQSRIDELSASAKEKFNTIYGYFGNLWDMFGIVAASVPVLAGITALSAVIATVGMAIGIIAAELGAAFAYVSHRREKALAGTQEKLEQQEFSEDLQHIAEYARKQKNKKKKRQLAVAAGGLTVAVLAGVGLVGGPVAIVMAVLGAAVGIGFILYKWYRKKKGKKRAMEALVKGAVDNDDPDSKEALLKLGISDSEIANAAGDAGARSALERRVEQKLKDQRVDTANKLVGYVKNGKPSEKVGAEAILHNLGVDVKKVRDEYTQEKAVSKVAGKLASW